MTWRVLLAVGLAVLGCSPAAASAAAPQTTPQIVLYRDVPNPTTATRDRERQLGFTATHRYRYAVQGFSARLSAQQVDDLRRDPNVKAVVPDRPVHADSEPVVPGGVVPVGLTRTWAASGGLVRDAAGPAVAVVDTGIDLANTDLNVSAGTNCIGTGPPQDDNGHGTHVSGTIGALNNGDRVVGVAPGTQLYAVKVLGATGSGTVSSIICGLDWVTQNAAALGIKVVNMSLGGVGPIGTCSSDPEHSAICRLVNAGVTIVAAAGNDGAALSSGTGGHVPGAYPEVLTVTAMADTDGLPGGQGPACSADSDDTAASFSNYGSISDASHMIAAPGDCVVSLASGGGLKTMSGTSMATPHVTGAAALCMSEGATPGPCAGQAPADVIATLRSIAEAGANPADGFQGDPLSPLGRYYGYLLRAAIPPTVSTGSASAADHDATLDGTIDADGAASSWWFEYGPTTAYGQSSDAQLAAAGPDPVAVQDDVSGLDSGTTYHYRVVMQTGDWTIRGADGTFTTTGSPPPPPPDTQITLAPPSRTANGQVAIEFAAAPAAGASFECRLDTTVWSSCTSPYSASVGEGRHTFLVRATNGKPDPSPASTSWTVDLTPPDTYVGAGPPARTTSSSATFSFSASESPATFACRLDDGGWSACAAPYPLTGLSVGAHHFEVRATDAVGWLDDSPAAYDWTVTAPAGASAEVPLTPVAPAASGPSIIDAPGASLLPVARVLPRGAVRLDRRRGRVAVTLDCKGPGPCGGSFAVLIRGLSVARASFRIAAGGHGSFSLRLGRQGRRVLRRPAPRTAQLSLTRGIRTRLDRATTRLLT